MPTKAEDTVKKDVLYPDDLDGATLEIDGERLNGVTAFWHAQDENDAEDLPDGAREGWWLPVDSAEHGKVWAAMPRALREEIIDHDPGEIFEVVRLEKGPGDTDPYESEIAWIAS